MAKHEKMVKGLNQLTDSLIKGFNMLARDLNEQIEEDKGPDKGKKYAFVLTRISKALPKIAYTVAQLKLMQDEIDEKRRREKKEKKYSKADLLIAQRHIAKLLEEYEEQEAKEKEEADETGDAF
jgi:hypothetical protein